MWVELNIRVPKLGLKRLKNLV
uniref:Uncharacterized protein n=1 Tax=Zea mays TaxID=4577 RepID=C0PN59_MAIZE|nr:unknown [Zea mays]